MSRGAVEKREEEGQKRVGTRRAESSGVNGGRGEGVQWA